MTKSLLFLTLTFLCFSSIIAQDTLFKPSGKNILTIFSNYHNLNVGSTNNNYIEITRAYLGYDYQFNKNINGVVILDFGDQGNIGYKMTAFLKAAYLRYKNKKLTVDFGLVGTKQCSVNESYWERRYLYKSIQDYSKMGNTFDYGIIGEYVFSSRISADIGIFNGKGFKDPSPENPNGFRGNIGLTFKPYKSIFIRGFYDYSERTIGRQTLSLITGLKLDKYGIFAEIVEQRGNAFVSGKNYVGLSFFGNYNFNSSWKIFARYDKLRSQRLYNSSINWNLNSDGQLGIIGVEYQLTKGVRMSPNFQIWKSDDTSKDLSIGTYLSFEMKI